LYYLPFADDEIRLRERLLCTHFNNQRNGQKLIESIW
jgi:hypothetical protein